MTHSKDRGTLDVAEPHPSAFSAREWISKLDYLVLMRWQESFASCAISGKNRLAEVCSETLSRLMEGKPVSDRYVLGLAWAMLDKEKIHKGIDEQK